MCMNEARLRAFRKISVRALGRQANKKSKRVQSQAKSISHLIQVFRFAVAWNSDFFLLGWKVIFSRRHCKRPQFHACQYIDAGIPVIK